MHTYWCQWYLCGQQHLQARWVCISQPRTTCELLLRNTTHLPFSLHCCCQLCGLLWLINFHCYFHCIFCHSFLPKQIPPTHPLRNKTHPAKTPLKPLFSWLDQSLHLWMTQMITNHLLLLLFFFFFFVFFYFTKLHLAPHKTTDPCPSPCAKHLSTPQLSGWSAERRRYRVGEDEHEHLLTSLVHTCFHHFRFSALISKGNMSSDWS